MLLDSNRFLLSLERMDFLIKITTGNLEIDFEGEKISSVRLVMPAVPFIDGLPGSDALVRRLLLPEELNRRSRALPHGNSM